MEGFGNFVVVVVAALVLPPFESVEREEFDRCSEDSDFDSDSDSDSRATTVSLRCGIFFRGTGGMIGRR